jgi:hypothetical protein
MGINSSYSRGPYNDEWDIMEASQRDQIKNIGRKRPARDPHIFGIRYWNANGFAVAIVGVIGGGCRWYCEVCDWNAPFAENGICAHGHEHIEKVKIRGDWAAYIAGTNRTHFQEDAEAWAMKHGEKMDAAEARYMLREAIEANEHLISQLGYRR